MSGQLQQKSIEILRALAMPKGGDRHARVDVLNQMYSAKAISRKLEELTARGYATPAGHLTEKGLHAIAQEPV